MYADLQTAQDAAARRLLDALPAVKARFDPDAIGSAAPGSAGVFALAAIPARSALERGAWADAAKLVPQPSRYLYADAVTYFAKALGAARMAPARELVGEMLLQMNRPADALIEFEATIKKEPNRFRAVSGAARSAFLAGDRQKARTYYGSLLEICEPADKPGWPELVEARRLARRLQ